MRVLQTAKTEYRCALAAPFFLVSTEIAARTRVDMERAKSALDEHLSTCRPNTFADDRLVLAFSA
jgi:hypothetical protein